jgi:hypothetical protein
MSNDPFHKMSIRQKYYYDCINAAKGEGEAGYLACDADLYQSGLGRFYESLRLN